MGRIFGMRGRRENRMLAFLGVGGGGGIALMVWQGFSPANAVVAFGVAMIIGASLSDAFWGIIPNAFPLAGVAGLLLASLFIRELSGAQVFLGAVAGGGLLLALGYGLSLILKEEALGGGDVKLMALIGSLVGWRSVFPVLFWAASLALVWIACIFFFQGGPIRRSVRFGPWMGAAAILAVFFK